MGGGGDGGYGERQAQQDAQKQQARNALNVLFGVEPTGGRPDPARFVVTGSEQRTPEGETIYGTQDGFDQAGYDAALAEYAALAERAKANQGALGQLYAGVRQNAFDAGKRRLDEQRSTAARDLRFELAARGLNGGSVDVDQHALLGRVYGQGVTDLGAKADATRTALRTGDESTRVSLLQSIDNGMDQGSAISSALAQMRNNADRAASEATGTSLGNLFADSGLLYEQARRSRGERTFMEQWRASNQPGSAGARPSSAVTRGSTTFAG